MTSINCSNCDTAIEQTYEFCPHCGTAVASMKSKYVATHPAKESRDILGEDAVPHKEKYSSGIKTTFVWSIILSIATLGCYTFIEELNVDVVLKTLILGAINRPIIILLIAFIISIFFKTEVKKISTFNSSCYYLMTILSLAELLIWSVR